MIVLIQPSFVKKMVRGLWGLCNDMWLHFKDYKIHMNEGGLRQIKEPTKLTDDIPSQHLIRRLHGILVNFIGIKLNALIFRIHLI